MHGKNLIGCSACATWQLATYVFLVDVLIICIVLLLLTNKISNDVITLLFEPQKGIRSRAPAYQGPMHRVHTRYV